MELAVKENPDNTAARSRLLDYYYLDKSIDPRTAVAARRRHILWLIENAPDGGLAGTPQATIDPSGYALADATGYKLASEAWRRQAAKPAVKPAVLVNAAFFFKAIDKEYAVELLNRAVGLDPKNKEISARLGDEYALIILGVTLINRSGYPLRADPALTKSALANAAREALTNSNNPYVLAKAGYMLAWQGGVLYFSRRLPFDPIPLAAAAADRAVSVAPEDQGVAAYREEIRKYERMDQEARGSRKAPPAERPSVAKADGAPGVQSAPVTAPASTAAQPAAKQVTATELKTITVGMSREQVYRLGPPSGRITTDEDGHSVEILQYYVNHVPVGTVKLKDGTVSSVQVQVP